MIRTVKKINNHPSYRKSTFDFDYSVFELNEPVSFTDYVEPVCLPNVEDVDGLDAGQEVEVTGWGRLMHGGHQSDILQVTQVETMPNRACKLDFYLNNGYPITDRMLCAWKRDDAGKTISDSCGGDSGGQRYKCI